MISGSIAEVAGSNEMSKVDITSWKTKRSDRFKTPTSERYAIRIIAAPLAKSIYIIYFRLNLSPKTPAIGPKRILGSIVTTENVPIITPEPVRSKM